MILTEKVCCTGKASIGSGADYDFEITEFIFKLFDDCLGCIYFTYAYGVKPDTFFVRNSAGDFSKSLVPAAPVAFVSYSSIYNNGAVRYHG